MHAKDRAHGRPRTEGKTKTFVVPLAVKLCNEKLPWSKQCNALKV